MRVQYQSWRVSIARLFLKQVLGSFAAELSSLGLSGVQWEWPDSTPLSYNPAVIERMADPNQ